MTAGCGWVVSSYEGSEVTSDWWVELRCRGALRGEGGKRNTHLEWREECVLALFVVETTGLVSGGWRGKG